MKRIGIITLYDYLNQVDNCTQRLISELRFYLNYIFIVCNFIPDDEDYIFLERNSEYLLVRENIGFDGGAVKDAMTIILSNKADICMDDFDELCIINDTFYGFFYPLNDFFKWFNNSDNDFAGFTKNEGNYLWMKKNVPEHVQGYFMIIKRQMFSSRYFIDFWNNFRYPLTSTDNIFSYEYNFSDYFSSKGFKLGAFYDLKKWGITKIGDVDYLDYPCELINYVKYPIFKYKAAWIDFLNDSSYRALKFIKSSFPECFQDIMKHVRKSSGRMYINQDKLMDFCEERDGIYIYGEGVIGKRIFYFLNLLEYRFKGFVVTYASEEDRKRNVYSIKDISLKYNDGIVVGMNRHNVLEVKEYLDQKFELNKIFYPKLK